MWEAVRAPTATATGQCMRYVRIFFRLTVTFILGSRACPNCFSRRLSSRNLIVQCYSAISRRRLAWVVYARGLGMRTARGLACCGRMAMHAVLAHVVRVGGGSLRVLFPWSSFVATIPSHAAYGLRDGWYILK